MNAYMVQQTERKVKPMKPVCQLTFEHAGYDPETALDMFNTDKPLAIIYTAHAGQSRPAGDTLGAIAEWMADEGLRLFGQPTCKNSKRGGRWCGRYTVTLGKEVQ